MSALFTHKLTTRTCQCNTPSRLRRTQTASTYTLLAPAPTTAQTITPHCHQEYKYFPPTKSTPTEDGMSTIVLKCHNDAVHENIGQTTILINEHRYFSGTDHTMPSTSWTNGLQNVTCRDGSKPYIPLDTQASTFSAKEGKPFA